MKCCFIGHRNIEQTEKLKQKLINIIEDLITNHNVNTFLFGSRSHFNDLCHTVVTELKKKYSHICRIAYNCKSETSILESEREQWKKFYQLRNLDYSKIQGFENECDFKNKHISHRASYVTRNYAMIDDSDYCIFYYDENYLPEMRKYSKRSIGYYQPRSGTALAYSYAISKKKIIINTIC